MPEMLIWGASGGIGGALVTAAKAAGWRVFAAARDEGRIPRGAEHTYRFDAAAPHTVAAIPPMIAPESDGLDLVVYAAGMLRSAMLDRQTDDDWRAVMESNLHGAYRAAQASLPLLKDGGQMLFIGAYVEHVLLPKMGAYAAAKAALEPLAAVLRKENRKLRFGIVRPGPVVTAFWANAPFKMPAEAKAPAVVAAAILAHHAAGEAGDLNL